MIVMTHAADPYVPSVPDGLAELGRLLVLQAWVLALTEPELARRRLARARTIFEHLGDRVWLGRIADLEARIAMEGA